MRNKQVNYISLGKQLREQRKCLNLTQAEVAEKVDVSTNFIGQLERGEKVPSIETLIALANLLNLSTDSILSEYLTSDVSEEKIPYMTDKQMKVLSKIVRLIKDNF